MRLASIFTFVIALAIGCHPQPEKQNGVVPVVQKHFPNTLANKKFKTGQLIGLTPDTVDYSLIPAAQVDNWEGYSIQFVDSVNFISNYEAWCGNDCFTTILGRYYFIDSVKVRFYTDYISRSSDCKEPSVYTKFQPPLDLYLVKGLKNRLQLDHKPNTH